ncbi:MAG: hypothetical protein EPN85_11695 [Bacteroidetes bacterium]|nr:MAG: hypothetical protein EPN85_11695 [Bacteroidota bacterium]
MKNFIIKLSIFTLMVATINFCWIRFAPLEKHVPHIWFMVAFFALITILFHYFSLNASKGRPQDFIRFYMGSTALRLFLYLLAIVTYRFYDKPTLIPFALGFMAHYFLFTVFEVPILLKELKKL